MDEQTRTPGLFETSLHGFSNEGGRTKLPPHQEQPFPDESNFETKAGVTTNKEIQQNPPQNEGSPQLPPSVLSPSQKQILTEDPFATRDPGTVSNGQPADIGDPFATNPGLPETNLSAKPTKKPDSNHQDIAGYEILKELGRGGMGVVYKARHPKLNRIVALKMILSGANAGSQDMGRFLIEAEAIARLQHPNIIQLYEFGEHEGLPFFTLEYVSGGCLSDLIKDQPLPPRLAAQVVLQIARGMAFAHEKGIVHRDLKPANILVQENGLNANGLTTKGGGSTKSGLEIKITDFGLAKKVETDSELTGTNAIMGSPCYMAPEQAKGDTSEIDAVSDVYGIGAIFYQLITGRPPFQAAKIMEVLRQVIEKDPLAPSQLGIKLDRDVETICLKCLEKEKNKRYPSAELLANDIERYLNNEPITARPPGITEKIGKWVKRKPLTAALWGVSVLAGIGLFASIGLYAQYQRQQAGIYQKDLESYQKQQEALDKSKEYSLKAKDLENSEDWGNANTELQKALSVLEENPDLDSSGLKEEIILRIASVNKNILKADQRKSAKNRYSQFLHEYDNAQFYYTFFTGIDPVKNFEKTLESVKNALGLYRIAHNNPKELTNLTDEKNILDPKDHIKLINYCYELFIIAAETEATLLPGQKDSPEMLRSRAEKALVYLDLAESLGKQYQIVTGTFEICKAKYRAMHQGKEFTGAERNKDNQNQNNIGLDGFLLALEKYHNKKWIDTIEALKIVLKEQNDHFWAHYVTGLCFIRLNQWEKAKGELTVCTNLKPAFAWPLLLRGFATSELGNREKEQNLKQSEFTAARQDYDQALKDPDPLVQYVGLTNRGALEIRMSNWSQAVKDLENAVRVNPKGLEAYLNLSRAFEALGSSDKGLEAIGKAIEIDPTNSILYETRAAMEWKEKQVAKAQTDYEKSIRFHRNGNDMNRLLTNWIELGKIHFQENRYTEALKAYDQALKIDPNSGLTERYRAETFLRIGDYAKAAISIDHYLEILGTKPAPAKVYELRGLIFAGTGKIPAAIEMYTMALKQNPEEPQLRAEIRCHRAWAYFLNDAYRLSLEDFNSSIENDKIITPDALVGRGISRMKLNMGELAIKDAESAEKTIKKENLTFSGRQSYMLAALYAQGYSLAKQKIWAGNASLDQNKINTMNQYKTKCLDFLKLSLNKQAPEKRSEYWNDEVENNPNFVGIRNQDIYKEIASKYPPVKKPALKKPAPIGVMP